MQGPSQQRRIDRGRADVSRSTPGTTNIIKLTVPNAACKPATESPKLIFGRTGGPESTPVSGSGYPLIYLNPDSASQTEA